MLNNIKNTNKLKQTNKYVSKHSIQKLLHKIEEKLFFNSNERFEGSELINTKNVNKFINYINPILKNDIKFEYNNSLQLYTYYKSSLLISHPDLNNKTKFVIVRDPICQRLKIDDIVKIDTQYRESWLPLYNFEFYLSNFLISRCILNTKQNQNYLIKCMLELC